MQPPSRLRLAEAVELAKECGADMSWGRWSRDGAQEFFERASSRGMWFKEEPPYGYIDSPWNSPFRPDRPRLAVAICSDFPNFLAAMEIMGQIQALVVEEPSPRMLYNPHFAVKDSVKFVDDSMVSALRRFSGYYGLEDITSRPWRTRDYISAIRSAKESKVVSTYQDVLTLGYIPLVEYYNNEEYKDTAIGALLGVPELPKGL